MWDLLYIYVWDPTFSTVHPVTFTAFQCPIETLLSKHVLREQSLKQALVLTSESVRPLFARQFTNVSVLQLKPSVLISNNVECCCYRLIPLSDRGLRHQHSQSEGNMTDGLELMLWASKPWSWKPMLSGPVLKVHLKRLFELVFYKLLCPSVDCRWSTC